MSLYQSASLNHYKQYNRATILEKAKPKEKSSMETPRFLSLYQDAEFRRNRQEKLTDLYNKALYPFQPNTQETAKSLDYRDITTRLYSPRVQKQPDDNEFTFKPSIGRGPNKDYIAISERGSFSMMQLRKVEVEEAHCPEISKRSEKLVQNMSKRCYQALFQLLNPDGDEFISYDGINIDRIDPMTYKIILPLLNELEDSQEMLNYEEFAIAMNNLFKIISPADKAYLITPKPRSSYNSTAFSFKPSTRKSQNSKQSKQSNTLYQRGINTQAKKQSQAQVAQTDRLINELQECSFRPKTTKYRPKQCLIRKSMTKYINIKQKSNKMADKAGSHYVTMPEELAGGPIQSRRCTDILCLLIFSVFVLAMLAAGVLGFLYGNPSLLLYPYDSSGNQCGNPDTKGADYHYLYFITPTDSNSPTVCLKSCPNGPEENVDCLPNAYVTDCQFTIADKNESSSVKPYASSKYLGRFCKPDKEKLKMSSLVLEGVLGRFQSSQVIEWAVDVANCWLMLIGIIGIAFVVSVFYMIFLRYCMTIAIFIGIAAIFVVTVVFGLFLWWTADKKYQGEEYETKYYVFKGLACTCWGVTLILLLILMFMCKRIRLTIAVMKSGVLFLKESWKIFLVPIAALIFSIIFDLYWIASLFFIYSAGDLVKNDDKQLAFPHIEWNGNIQGCFYFEFFGILWVNAFKVAVTQLVIAGAVCFWYFDLLDNVKDGKYIRRSVSLIFKYHLGTAAFGSFLLSLVKFIKWMLTYIQTKVAARGESANRCVRCCCGCLLCCINCFERFIEYIDKNAYIRTALCGESFCTAAKNAFYMILQNAARFAAMGSIGEVINFIGKALITVVATALGFFIITKVDYFDSQTSSPIPPTVVFFILAYLTSSLFINVYGMVCDTIIVVYIADELSNNNDAKYAPAPLREFMKEHRHERDEGKCC